MGRYRSERVRFRRTDAKGEQSGGPMFYLTYGVGGRFGATLGVLFAVFGALAAFGIGNMVQSNSVADAVNAQWDVPMWLTGAVITVLAAVVRLLDTEYIRITQ